VLLSRFSKWFTLTPDETDQLQFARLRAKTKRAAKKAKAAEKRKQKLIDLGFLPAEEDPRRAMEEEVTENRMPRGAAGSIDGVSFVLPSPSSLPQGALLGASSLVEESGEESDYDSDSEEGERSLVVLQRHKRIFDTRAGFYVNVSALPLLLREEPCHGATLMTLGVPCMQPFRAEERTVLGDGSVFVRVASRSGSGWLPFRVDGIVMLRAYPATQVVLEREYNAEAGAPPSVAPIQSDSTDSVAVDADDPALHRFRALQALCPEGGLNRDVIELVFPAGSNEFEVDAFIRRYDLDGDGCLSFHEYLGDADDELRLKWRFRSIWGRFAAADLDLNGFLTADEMMPFMPPSTTELERPKWLAKADRHGTHGVLTIADLPLLLHMAQKDERQLISTAAVTMSVFICYIRTAKAIMAMFSIENINGVAYLKKEIGTKAYTQQHFVAISIASIYGFLFIFCVPVSAMYIIFANRASFKTRKVQAAFGFLFEGYRPKMFFWEFLVLLRKVVILGVSLFWEDAFLQSIVALFVLVVSIVVHMACWPYEEHFLNVAELCSLFCLFTLVALAVLLWYIQSPGKTQYVILYELAVTGIIFVMYGALMVVLIARVIYLEVRERSKSIVDKLAATRRIFDWFVSVEEWLYFNVTHATLEKQEDMWSYLREEELDDGDAAKEGGLAETKSEKAKRLLARAMSGRFLVPNALQQLPRSGGGGVDGSASLTEGGGGAGSGEGGDASGSLSLDSELGTTLSHNAVNTTTNPLELAMQARALNAADEGGGGGGGESAMGGSGSGSAMAVGAQQQQAPGEEEEEEEEGRYII